MYPPHDAGPVDAIVPAAGRGTRMGHLTADRPKPLVEVAGRPLVAHVLDALVDAGADRLVVVVGDRGDQVREVVGDAVRATPVRYVAQPEPLGLGDAVARARDAVDDAALVLNGDNVVAGNLADVAEAGRDADAAVLVDRVARDVAAETGVVVVEEGRVVRAVEKPADPPARTVAAGCYWLGPAAFDACDALAPDGGQEAELTAALDGLARAGGEVRAVPFEGERVNVNEPADRERAAAVLRRG